MHWSQNISSIKILIDIATIEIQIYLFSMLVKFELNSPYSKKWAIFTMLDIYKYNKGMAKKKIFSARENKLSSSLSSLKLFKEKLEKSKNIKLCKIWKVWKDFERSIKELKEKLLLVKSKMKKFEILNILHNKITFISIPHNNKYIQTIYISASTKLKISFNSSI